MIVDKSTVPVGTAGKVSAAIAEELQKRDAVIGYSVTSNPEFLKEGAAVVDFIAMFYVDPYSSIYAFNQTKITNYSICS